MTEELKEQTEGQPAASSSSRGERTAILTSLVANAEQSPALGEASLYGADPPWT